MQPQLNAAPIQQLCTAQHSLWVSVVSWNFEIHLEFAATIPKQKRQVLPVPGGDCARTAGSAKHKYSKACGFRFRINERVYLAQVHALVTSALCETQMTL
jgi:hypothetical protein